MGQQKQPAQATRLNLSLNKIKQAAELANAIKNPDAAISSIISNNPLVKQAQEVAAQYGGDYDAAFLGTCKKAGIDPTDLARQIKSIL
jgi:hypothetical protein